MILNKNCDSLIITIPLQKQREELKLLLNKTILQIQNISMDVTAKDKLLPLLQLFFLASTEGQSLTKSFLLQYIYDFDPKDSHSERKKMCLNHNVNKLLSRTRVYFKKITKPLGLHIEWFPYDRDSKSWFLFREYKPAILRGYDPESKL